MGTPERNSGRDRYRWIRDLPWRAIVEAIAAVVVVSAAYCGPEFVENQTIKGSQIAMGEWMSHWRWDHEPEGVWHWETLQLETHRGKIRIRTTYSPEGNEWVGEGRLVSERVHGNHVVGSWWSTKPGAIASGPFALTTLASHGESMYGYFGDYENVTGRAVVGTWVMGRDSNHTEQAKRWITEHRTPQPMLGGSGQ